MTNTFREQPQWQWVIFWDIQRTPPNGNPREGLSLTNCYEFSQTLPDQTDGGWPNFTISAKFHNPGIPGIHGIPGVRAVSQFLRRFYIQHWFRCQIKLPFLVFTQSLVVNSIVCCIKMGPAMPDHQRRPSRKSRVSRVSSTVLATTAPRLMALLALTLQPLFWGHLFVRILQTAVVPFNLMHHHHQCHPALAMTAKRLRALLACALVMVFPVYK